MPRGGKRRGAGRKLGSTSLEWDQRFWIGQECLRVQRVLVAEQNGVHLTPGELTRIALDKLLVDAQKARLAERSEAFNGILEKYELLRGLPKKHRRNMQDHHEEWLEDVRALRDEFGANYISVPGFPAYRVRNRVLKTVSETATKRYARPVSVRMVRSCWDKYNRFEREVTSELLDGPTSPDV